MTFDLRKTQLPSQVVALLFGMFVMLIVACVFWAAQALAQANPPLPVTVIPPAPALSGWEQKILAWIWPMIGTTVSGVLIWLSTKAFAAMKAWGDARLKNDKFRTAWDHFNDALANAVLHVEQAERPNIVALGQQYFANGKLTQDGVQKAKDAAVTSLKADAGPSLAVLQDVLGHTADGFKDFLDRAVNAEVLRQKQAAAAPAPAPAK